MVDKGMSRGDAAQKVKDKFLGDICGADKDTYFYVGTVLGRGTWVVIGVFYPKKSRMPDAGYSPLFG